MTDFQSEQLDYNRSGDQTGDLKHISTLTIPLSRHRSIKRKIASRFIGFYYQFEGYLFNVLEIYKGKKTNVSINLQIPKINAKNVLLISRIL